MAPRVFPVIPSRRLLQRVIFPPIALFLLVLGIVVLLGDHNPNEPWLAPMVGTWSILCAIFLGCMFRSMGAPVRLTMDGIEIPRQLGRPRVVAWEDVVRVGMAERKAPRRLAPDHHLVFRTRAGRTLDVNLSAHEREDELVRSALGATRVPLEEVRTSWFLDRFRFPKEAADTR